MRATAPQVAEPGALASAAHTPPDRLALIATTSNTSRPSLAVLSHDSGSPDERASRPMSAPTSESRLRPKSPAAGPLSATATATAATSPASSQFALRDPRVDSVPSVPDPAMSPADRLLVLSDLIQAFSDQDVNADAGATTTAAKVAAPGALGFVPGPLPPVTGPVASDRTSAPISRTKTPTAPLAASTLAATASPPAPAPAFTQALVAPTTPQYHTQRTLLDGSAGKIKLATHILTGEQVVIKCLDKARLQLDADAWHAALREISVTASLAHPHIAPLLHVLDSPTAVLLVFQFEPGGDLLDYLVRRAKERTALVLSKAANSVAPTKVAAAASGMSEPRARHLFVQIADAVQYCHERGIVHRDLKPDNILLDPHGYVKLIDFGFTNVLESKSQLINTYCGSLSYSAPEMLAKQPYEGMPADVWSLGVTLYVMCTGKSPFDESNITAMFAHMSTGDILYPADMSAELKSLLKSMLDPDPTRRASIQAVLAHPWVLLDDDGEEERGRTPPNRDSPFPTATDDTTDPDATSMHATQGSDASSTTSRLDRCLEASSSSATSDPGADTSSEIDDDDDPNNQSRTVVFDPVPASARRGSQDLVDESILELMLTEYATVFPDAARTTARVMQRVPSHEFATYELLRERARRELAKPAVATVAAEPTAAVDEARWDRFLRQSLADLEQSVLSTRSSSLSRTASEDDHLNGDDAVQVGGGDVVGAGTRGLLGAVSGTTFKAMAIVEEEEEEED
ncbi:CAMK/CAMKL protein kinase [Allomyces macrogynus ATCC 38327]|uniref:CAMK/CAMKL protein kinase n=1 Tax=Allomyces macrogynus (strain ATCC 38327) TaxID=578462 RepID=A0A0L0SIG3_ALLM3|nr:CAMK/CAMKL protein kinase [Allomyces macrogynus ATCC 38327]|eukprot:KNE62262.1 CAMK/CAMKL protein kinase [Allomyces macrogynus ATCC 38327]